MALTGQIEDQDTARVHRRSLRKRLRDRLGVAADLLRRKRGTMDTPWRRRLALIEHVFFDHAMFRYIYLNLHPVVPGIERSAQPSPRHIRAAARRGVRTIVNLRGERDCASYLLQKAACERHGIRLVDFSMKSRAAPALDRIEGLAQILAEAERPILLHCKSGADRAGIASALAVLLEGGSGEAASAQLSLRYGHVRQAKTGVLDAVIERYRADTAREPAALLDWAATRYDPAEFDHSFTSRRWADVVTDTVLDRE